MEDFHQPVLVDEIIALLKIESGKKYIDATIGGGGHTKEILKMGGIVLGIEVDPDAISYLKEHFKSQIANNQLILANTNFIKIGEVAKKLGFGQVSAIFFDLGVSLYQLKSKERGFGFESETLDMRMDPNLKIAAFDLVNNLDKRRLYEAIKNFGQERAAWKVVNAIDSARKIKPIESAKELAQIIAMSKSRTKSKIHPATQTFQALRIVVNSELESLKLGMRYAIDLLEPKGRIGVISFHSLEDHIVKEIFKSHPDLRVITKKPIQAKDMELFLNPKARSAKLRVAEINH